jgi:hypothetical protein
MTDTIPRKKSDGLPPARVHFPNRRAKPCNGKQKRSTISNF